MRPVNKGSWPTTPVRSLKIKFTDWSKAIPILKQRTGWYCHLCEMRVTNALAIEHIKPKEHFSKLESHWDNFLLICNHCNSSKLAKVPQASYRRKYYWPHLNNTLLAFEYGHKLPFISPAANLSKPQRARAVRLIRLYSLNKQVNSNGESDTRWIEKMSALKDAIDSLIEYQNSKITVESITRLAKKTGFFAIWLSIFNNTPQVKEALINCSDFHVSSFFDLTLHPIPRNLSNPTDPI